MLILVNGEKKSAPAKSAKIAYILEKLKIPREEVIVKLNGKIIPEDAVAGEKDKLEIIRVVFGG